MALTVKHLNSDASFLLTFEPLCSDAANGFGTIARPFIILIDPWITGPSKIFHSRFSLSTQKEAACVSSLAELPEPDLVIISQHKTDHCNEATLRQLPSHGTKTLIVAEPASARLIRSWKYFDHNKIRTIHKWEDPKISGRSSIIRIPVPATISGCLPGEVTVAWIPQKRDLTSLHSAIGITYRPPPTQGPASFAAATLSPSLMITPPATPGSPKNSFDAVCAAAAFALPPSEQTVVNTADILPSPPISPISPWSHRSVKSVSALPNPLIPAPLNINRSRSTSRALYTPPQLGSVSRHVDSSNYSHDDNTYQPPDHRHPFYKNQNQAQQQQSSRPLSLIFSPHGITYPSLANYATSHLVSEAALPLTALLHCMDAVSNPWWLGGNVCAGAPAGAEIVRRLGARVWVGAHDGDKKVSGLATVLLRIRRWGKDEILDEVFPVHPDGGGDGDKSGENKTGSLMPSGSGTSNPGRRIGGQTEILRLGSGEDVVVTGDGMVLRGHGHGQEHNHDQNHVPYPSQSYESDMDREWENLVRVLE